MLRPTQFKGESFENSHQGSNPTQFTESGFGDGDVNPRATSNANVGEGNVNPTQYVNIGDGVNTTAATADHEGRLERLRQIAEFEIRQRDIKEQENMELARRQAYYFLRNQEQAHREEANAAIQQVHGEAHEAINQAHGAANREKQETQDGSCRAKD